MTEGEIHHVNVVTHACAIRGRIVIAKHPQLLELADPHLADIGQQVVGDAVGIFAYEAALVGANRVEVAQQHYGPAQIGFGQVTQYLFHHQLGATIGIGRAGGEIFPQRHRRRIAIHGGRRAEHQAADPGAFHRLQQGEGAAQIVLVVFEGETG